MLVKIRLLSVSQSKQKSWVAQTQDCQARERLGELRRKVYFGIVICLIAACSPKQVKGLESSVTVGGCEGSPSDRERNRSEDGCGRRNVLFSIGVENLGIWTQCLVFIADSGLEDSLVAWHSKEQLRGCTVKTFSQAMTGAGCAGTVAGRRWLVKCSGRPPEENKRMLKERREGKKRNTTDILL